MLVLTLKYTGQRWFDFLPSDTALVCHLTLFKATDKSQREWDMFDLKIVILQFLTDLVQTRHKHSLPYSDKWENIVFTNK